MGNTYQMPWLAWLQGFLAALALVLAVLSYLGAISSRELQKTAADNAARLARANTFATLDNGLIQLTAKSAVDNNDDALTALLAQNGVTFRKSATPISAGSNP